MCSHLGVRVEASFGEGSACKAEYSGVWVLRPVPPARLQTANVKEFGLREVPGGWSWVGLQCYSRVCSLECREGICSFCACCEGSSSGDSGT